MAEWWLEVRCALCLSIPVMSSKSITHASWHLGVAGREGRKNGERQAEKVVSYEAMKVSTLMAILQIGS